MFGINGETYEHNTEGRWPANIIFDEEAGKILDEQNRNQNGRGEVKGRNALKPAHEPIVMARKPF